MRHMRIKSLMRIDLDAPREERRRKKMPEQEKCSGIIFL